MSKDNEGFGLDRFRGRLFAKYSVEEIEQFLGINHLGFNSKQGIELLVGCILSRCSEKLIEELPLVGFLMKGTYPKTNQIPRPALSEIIGNKYIEDKDFDIQLQYHDHHCIIQITRLEKHGAKDDANQGLMNLIDKKLNVQKDDLLQLVICLDHTFDLDEAKLEQFLKDKSVPYKRIYIVGQFGEIPKFGEFRCMEIFPEITYSHIKLNI